MAYEKQTWVAHETPVGAARLNHMEEGVAALSEEMTAMDTIQETVETPVRAEDIITSALVLDTGKVMTGVDPYVCTEMLPIDYDAGNPVTVRCSIVGTCSLAFYDADGVAVLVISGKNCADYGITAGAEMQEVSVTPPDSTRYVRLSASTASYTKPNDFRVSTIKSTTLHGKIKAMSDSIGTLNDAVGIKTERKAITVTEADIITDAFVHGANDGDSYGQVKTGVTGYVCTQLLPTGFKAGAQVELCCTLNGNCGFAFYDKNGAVLLAGCGHNASDFGATSSATMQTFYVDAPEDNAYIRVSAYASSISYTGPDAFVIRGMVDVSIRSSVDALKTNIAATETKINDAKVLVLGDSISTDYYGSYPKWVTHLTEIGFFNPVQIKNDSIHATGFVARYGDAANDFISRIEAVADPETYDLVIVFGGINDYIQSIPMGESAGDKTANFKPAVDYFFQHLVNSFTNARIAVLSPLRTSNVNKNTAGYYQTDYADYIKTVAKSYCLPVLNLTDESGFCPYVSTFKDKWTLTPDGFENADGVHPTEEYERRFLAPMIRHFLQGLM